MRTDVTRSAAQPGRRSRLAAFAVLACAAVLLSGCGMALRVGYGQGPFLSYRWRDGYVDFDDRQEMRVKDGLDDFFAWHRRTQLADYASLLQRAQTEIVADTTPERMCAWTQQFRTRVDAALEKTLPTLTEVMVTLTPQQIGNVEKKYAEKNAEYRDDYLQKDPGKRRKAAIDREVERAETLYGSLDAQQKERIVRAVDASPYDAERAYAERLLRQQDALAMMRKLVQVPSTRADAETAIRAYVQRLERSPRDDYRVYAQRVVEHNCAFAAQLHNATSAEQRRHAAKKLRSWEGDLRALAAETGKPRSGGVPEPG